ncbi:rod shape-determining protein MreD [Flammeovirga yaeyamensis]|uniref:Rod shape-determining protein MreD n=1 Tax=Flammeovirga yaeyamensis TaxID=367791 RepID=A0AAX1N987_9BACT|nr:MULTISPECIES: hypothetical protein [Flammeovirga]ANQ50213.1 rod shape-determining protein MreD [Flammeovirga sp. MY04]MBB3699826.1 hypothetical protein [Flammeovirga yaeyamensis]NMF36605.1 rod shape-determining protein MreD [Flammeovirga yaeyamensis]QWG02348.1 rod shape-determining protein MreD [Flammeovirga yaeyamensis]
MGREIWLKQVGVFFIYLFAQVLFFRNLTFFDGNVMIFPYVAFLVLLPFGADNMKLLNIAFVMGFVMDIFYDSIGIHTAACVGMAFTRYQIIKVTAPSGGYDLSDVPLIGQMGFGTFITFVIPQVLIHHILLFSIEAADWGFMPKALFRAFLSSIATIFIILAVQYLFYKGFSRRRI